MNNEIEEEVKNLTFELVTLQMLRTTLSEVLEKYGIPLEPEIFKALERIEEKTKTNIETYMEIYGTGEGDEDGQ